MAPRSSARCHALHTLHICLAVILTSPFLRGQSTIATPLLPSSPPPSPPYQAVSPLSAPDLDGFFRASREFEEVPEHAPAPSETWGRVCAEGSGAERKVGHVERICRDVDRVLGPQR